MRATGYLISLWTFFLSVNVEVIASHHGQPSSSTSSGVHLVCGQHILTFFHLVGGRSQYLQKNSQDVAQDILHSPCLVAKLCLTLCDPVDCSPPGSSVHGILQARILEWVAIALEEELSPGLCLMAKLLLYLLV